MNVRTAVSRGIIAAAQPGITANEGDLAHLIEKVEKANPKSLEHFAFTVGRNWAIDRARRAKCAARRVREEAERREAEAAKRRTFEEAREETRRLIERLTTTVKRSQLVHLQLVWWKVFEGKSAEEIGLLLPDVERDCRIKWYQRGRDLLIRHADPQLADFLNHRVSQAGGLCPSRLPN